MAENARTAKRRPLTWLWMLLALVTVGGFLTWLGLTSEPSTVAIVESDDGDGDVTPDGFTVVTRDSLAANKAGYEGQLVEVPSLEATGALGPVVFWGELGTQQNQVPILVRMDSTLAAAGMQVTPGSHYLVRGSVQRMTDSIATAWGEQGVLPDEGARLQATFADYFIEASNIRPAQGAPGGAGTADDSAEPQG